MAGMRISIIHIFVKDGTPPRPLDGIIGIVEDHWAWKRGVIWNRDMMKIFAGTAVERAFGTQIDGGSEIPAAADYEDFSIGAPKLIVGLLDQNAQVIGGIHIANENAI
jgi:hypothetical protein